MINYFKKITLYESALLIAVVHFIFLIIIQIENFVFYVSELDGNQQDMLSYVGELGFDNIFVSMILGVFVFFMLNHILLRIVCFIFIVSFNAYLVVDQISFKIFFDHLNLNLLEGTAGLDVLISSIVEEIDGAFYINVFYWLFSSVLFLFVIFFSKGESFKYFKSSNKIIPPVFVFLVSSSFLVFATNESDEMINQHPMVSLLTYSNVDKGVELIVSNNEVDFYKTQFDVVNETPEVIENIDNVEFKIKLNKKRPNIILIVMESVGSQQLLTENGLPSKKITPAIHSLAKNSVIFDSLYSVYPATVLSHVSMSTGGPAITLGNVYKDLSYTYQGLTLNKGLSALNYQTAIFSSQKLNYGNMGGFYKRLGFDKYFDFGEADQNFQKQHALHSWGGEESAVMNEAIAWIDEVKDLEKPFFMQYLSNATHHPYSTPESFKDRVKEDSKKNEYINSLAYSDQVISELIEYLKQNNLLENTVIAIVGDHGEAFGDKHEKNITHKNYLFEENIKNFLMISAPGLIDKTIVSNRISTIGDVMPTLLSFAKAPQVFLPAQNLLSRNYEPRVAFFHKNSPPNLWGLRDGKWKFIDTRLGSKPQLYDLNADPDESINLATLHPDKISTYRKLASTWYVSSNNLFLSKLAAYRPIGGVFPDEKQLQKSGPRGITFGFKDGNRFVEAKELLNKKNISVWISWIAYPKEKSLKFKWESPSGEIFQKSVAMFPGWADTIEKIPADTPLEVGAWKFSIYDVDEQLIYGGFNIKSEI